MGFDAIFGFYEPRIENIIQPLNNERVHFKRWPNNLDTSGCKKIQPIKHDGTSQCLIHANQTNYEWVYVSDPDEFIKINESIKHFLTK